MRISLGILTMACMLSIGCGEVSETTTATDAPPATANTAAVDAPAEDSGSTTEPAIEKEMVMVKLELPGMT